MRKAMSHIDDEVAKTLEELVEPVSRVAPAPMLQAQVSIVALERPDTGPVDDLREGETHPGALGLHRELAIAVDRLASHGRDALTARAASLVAD
jgi:hypothetical protein